MRLANEEMTITVDGVFLLLRPSLRAALCLAQKYDTFANLAGQITDGSLTAICDVIDAATPEGKGANDILAKLETHTVANVLSALQLPILTFILHLAGANEQAQPDTKQTSKPIPFTEHFENLFQIGSGALGWTPSQTWEATPAEIMAAYKGRIDLLKMIFGSEEKQEKRALTIDEKARLAFSAIGIKKAA